MSFRKVDFVLFFQIYINVTILFAILKSTGHLNFLISIAKTIQKLYKYEYEIWFLTNKEFKKKISRKLDNVNFLIYSRYVDEEERSELETTKQIIELFGKVGKIWEEKDRIKFSLGGGHVYPSMLIDKDYKFNLH